VAACVPPRLFLEKDEMSHHFADIAFTKGVKATQDQYGSREHNERLRSNFGPNDELSAREADFIAERDSFYMATVSETGWPYVQHRGGPAGFLKVLGPKKLAYIDFRGNRQLISVGNLSSDDRVSIILMDYPKRRRLKILGRMRVEDAGAVSPDALAQVELPDYRAWVERVIFIEVEAFDWNCPQHITPRYTESEYANHHVLQTDSEQRN
jgi:predicted pyridoxine 5'-phosphate oxidase superfamily flavin-nucleotide-binding protein